MFDKDKRRQLLKELTTLYESSCDQLVTFYGAFYKEGSIYIALELMPFGSLCDLLLQHNGSIPEFVLAALTKQVLQALLYLHKKKHMVGAVPYSSSSGVGAYGRPGAQRHQALQHCAHRERSCKTHRLRCVDGPAGLGGDGAHLRRHVHIHERRSTHAALRPTPQLTHQPERIVGADYSYQSDIWSLGISVLEW